MSADRMHAALTAKLKHDGASSITIIKWQALWEKAQEHRGEPLPCPVCIQQGKLARLIPLDNDGDNARARCKSCATTYIWPDDQ